MTLLSFQQYGSDKRDMKRIRPVFGINEHKVIKKCKFAKVAFGNYMQSVGVYLTTPVIMIAQWV
jgi:hypothetical protein